MDAFNRQWLNLWTAGVLIFGAVLAGFGLEGTDGAARMVFAGLGNPVPAAPDAHLRFAVALMGCVTLGWGVTFAAFLRAAWSLPAQQAASVWKLALISILVWFVPDSILSVATGFPRNVIPNTVLLGLFLIPVMRSGVLNG